MTTTLDQVFRALHDDLRGSPGAQTLDLAAAAASNPVTGLRPVLDLFTIGNTFVLSTADVRQNRGSVVATGNGSLAVKPGGEGAPEPLATAVAAMITIVSPGTNRPTRTLVSSMIAKPASRVRTTGSTLCTVSRSHVRNSFTTRA